ncbi:extracellular solute-binding protein [Amphibacillus jilinensis]|uniref:extracellular solute-binding protein n=1 Tax=Amphibacillus jilinensis TaxID=1216008 RepID=UPI0002D453D9|nr:extracellular solute-binding protein [Amphibacillus jilinensis]
MKKSIKSLMFIASLMLLVILVTACGQGDEDELVVYSSRNERFVQPLLDKFSEETGITVRTLHEADALQLKEETGNVQADIFISNDIGALEYLRMEDLLASFDGEGVETIDAPYRADDNSWIAISARSRGFIYNKDMITEEEMPKTMEALMDAEFEGQFAITRGGNGGMIGNVSALRNEWGDERTAEWVEAIKDNAGGIYSGHGDIRQAVGAGEHPFGLVNNYYYHQQLEEPNNNNVGFIYPDQGEGDMGVIANAAGVGLVNGAPNEEDAKAFIEWLLLPENQLEFVGESLEIPINADLEPPYEHAVRFADLKVQQMPLKDLGKYFEDTKELIEQSGLDLELR